jgi:alpha-1,6-mannosyltransferase
VGVLRAVVGLLVVLMALVIVRLPWIGDLGMHAATVERLRHDLPNPGDPLVRADAPSPYYSPWTVLLGCLARVSGLSVWNVLRVGAVVALGLLVSGVWRYARVLGGSRAAGPSAVLCVVLLWGVRGFAWSGFLGLDSLALTVAYPSVLASGLAFHLWAVLTRALRVSAGWGVFLAVGVLWAVVLLVHQFTGVVASLGVVGVLVGWVFAPAAPALPVTSRGSAPWTPWVRCRLTVCGASRARAAVAADSMQPRAPIGVRVVGAAALGVLMLLVWPYYDFFSLLRAGGGLEAVHRPLYDALPARYGLALLGVVALGVRAWRVRWDALVVFFLLGVAVFALGGVSGHWSWGRALPAVLIPAQLALALETCAAWDVVQGWWRAGLAVVVGGALAVGAWAQAGVLGYAVPRRVLPDVVAERSAVPWRGYGWIAPPVRYGDVVLARRGPARRIPAYGAYTVAPGYPDVFLADEAERTDAVRRYFAPGAAPAVRRAVERRYGVRWVVWGRGDGAPPGGLRRVAAGPGGAVLYEVVSARAGAGAVPGSP